MSVNDAPPSVGTSYALKRPKRTESRPLPQINYNSLVKEVETAR